MGEKQRVRKFLQKLKSRAQGVVTLDAPDSQDVAMIVADAIKLAATQGVAGPEKRLWAIDQAGKQLDNLFEGNPNHPLGRLFEMLDGPLSKFLVGIMVEAAYQAYKNSRST